MCCNIFYIFIFSKEDDHRNKSNAKKEQTKNGKINRTNKKKIGKNMFVEKKKKSLLCCITKKKM